MPKNIPRKASGSPAEYLEMNIEQTFFNAHMDSSLIARKDSVHHLKNIFDVIENDLNVTECELHSALCTSLSYKRMLQTLVNFLEDDHQLIFIDVAQILRKLMNQQVLDENYIEAKMIKVMVNSLFAKLIYCKEAEQSKRGKN